MSDLPPQPTATSGAKRAIRKPKGEGHSRRAEILASAERIFVEYGYEGATIRKIADDVGLSSTALYMHFQDKGQILQEICRVAFEQLLAATDRIVDEKSTPEARLRRILEAYVNFGFTNPNAYRLVYMTRPIEARHGAETAAQNLGGGLFRSFERVVESIHDAGRLKVEPKVAAQVFWAGAHGIVSLVITKPYFNWADRERLTRAMSDAMFQGLLKE